MRIVALVPLACTLLIGCRKPACEHSVEVQLAEVPEAPYEVTIEWPEGTHTWTCDEAADTGAAEDAEFLDCVNGTFRHDPGGRVRSASITVDGVSGEYVADCEKNRLTFNIACFTCTFLVEGT